MERVYGSRHAGNIPRWMGTAVLVAGLAGDQLAKVEEILHTVQELASLVRGQALSVESVENVLNESVGDFGGEVRFRKGVTG